MPPGNPIFVLGLTRRSGTNFVFQLLSLHPDVVPAKRIMEDFALHDAELLREYARRVRAHWNPRWGFSDDVEARLLRALGRGLSAFLSDEALAPAAAAGRPLFKTPSVRNLGLFFELFPAASLLVLVRDGRDVVESHLRSFGGSFEGASRAWRDAARTLLDFERAQRDRARHRVVRYEDLVRDPAGTLKDLLPFLELDASRFDFEAARALPVYGSSSFRGESAELHWQPVAKTEAFDPLGRWQSWGRYRRQRFAWLAGEPMVALGYELTSAHSQGERLLQRGADGAFALRERVRRLAAAAWRLRRRSAAGPPL